VASLGQEEQPGRFPQVSGLRYAYDATRKPGARITSITINGRPLDDKRTYTLATTTYVALEAGDGYEMFRNAPLLIRPEQAPSETDILQKAIASVRAIAPKVDGRIRRVDAGKDQSTCN
jgi:5'-nucleotidase